MLLSVLLRSKKCQYASAERRIEQKSSIMCGFRLVKDAVELKKCASFFCRNLFITFRKCRKNEEH